MQPLKPWPASRWVARPSDQLLLRVDLENLAPAASPTGTRLKRVVAAQPARVYLYFPPQSLVETVPNWQNPGVPDNLLGGQTLEARLSGWSCIRFTLPSAQGDLPGEIGALLAACAALGPDGAGTQQQAAPGPPGSRPSSSLAEVPYGIVLVPKTGVRAALAPAQRPGELWRLSLSGATIAGTEFFIAAGLDGDSFAAAISAQDRQKIVNAARSAQRSAFARRADLHSFGASLDLLAEWPGNASIQRWSQRTAIGRDSTAAVVEPYIVFPFGHQATLTRLAQRHFSQAVTLPPANVTRRAAALQGKQLFRIVEPSRAFSSPLRRGATATTCFPFASVAISPSVPLEIVPSPGSVFIPATAAGPIAFDLTFTDFAGRLVKARTPIVVAAARALPEQMPLAIKLFSSLKHLLGEQCFDFAPSTSAGENATAASCVTGTELFIRGDFDPQAKAPYPILERASVIVEQVRRPGAQAPVEIRHAKAYLEHQYGAGNRAKHFGEFVNPAPAALNKGAGDVGAVSGFGQTISNLSREFGALGADVPSLEKLLTGGNAPDDARGYFAKVLDLGATKLLGVIPLSDLLADGGVEQDAVPRIVSRRLYAKAGDMMTEDGLETEISWSPKCRNVSPISFASGPRPLTIKSTQKVSRAGASSLTTGRLDRFDIDFANVIRVHVETLVFTAEAGKAPVFELSGVEVQFKGDLRFVADLAERLKGLFGNGIFVDLRPDGLTVGISLAIPPLSIGIFALKDLAVGSQLRIPFDGRPARLGFSFNRRDAPCLLAVSIFAGTVFLAVETGLDKIQTVEAQLEFGGAVALNLGVASGSVVVLAGIYFRLGTPDVVQLDGHFRCGGCLEILAVVSISVEFYLVLGLTIEASSRKSLKGQATVTVTVKIAFFSKSVSLSVEKSFEGSDPTFAQLLRPGDWERYCEAFAS